LFFEIRNRSTEWMALRLRPGFLNQRVVELFPRNTKYCFNGLNIGYFVIKINISQNMYILNTFCLFCYKEEVKTGLKRLPNGFAFHPRPKSCSLWWKTGCGVIWFEKRWFRRIKKLPSVAESMSVLFPFSVISFPLFDEPCWRTIIWAKSLVFIILKNFHEPILPKFVFLVKLVVCYVWKKLINNKMT